MDSYNHASNYGGIDIWAPAKNVPSAHWATNGARDPYAVRQPIYDPLTATWRDYDSGTSWAAPLVTGMVVRTLELYPSWTPAQIEADLKADATKVNTIWNGTFSTENLLWGGMCRIRIVGH